MYSKNTQNIREIYVFLQNLLCNYFVLSRLFRDFVLLTSCDKFLHIQKIFCDFFMYFVQTFLQYSGKITGYFKRMHGLTLFLNLKQPISWKFFSRLDDICISLRQRKAKKRVVLEKISSNTTRLIVLFLLACCNRFFFDASLRQLRQERTGCM